VALVDDDDEILGLKPGQWVIVIRTFAAAVIGYAVSDILTGSGLVGAIVAAAVTEVSFMQVSKIRSHLSERTSETMARYGLNPKPVLSTEPIDLSRRVLIVVAVAVGASAISFLLLRLTTSSGFDDLPYYMPFVILMLALSFALLGCSANEYLSGDHELGQRALVAWTAQVSVCAVIGVLAQFSANDAAPILIIASFCYAVVQAIIPIPWFAAARLRFRLFGPLEMSTLKATNLVAQRIVLASVVLTAVVGAVVVAVGFGIDAPLNDLGDGTRNASGPKGTGKEAEDSGFDLLNFLVGIPVGIGAGFLFGGAALMAALFTYPAAALLSLPACYAFTQRTESDTTRVTGGSERSVG
jgi:hypothetical protein